MRVPIDEHSVLVVVDVQNDFCPRGAVPVPQGDKVVPMLNEYVKKFRNAGAAIIFTRDWHPHDHSSFKSQGGPWPPHCVQGSKGAEFHEALVLPPGAEVVSKADKRDEAYSFFQGTDLAREFHQRDLTKMFVGGLATDYCVKETVLDGLKNGFEVYHLDDASRGVNVQSNDAALALAEMVKRGAKRVTLNDLATTAVKKNA
ncbi:MAG: isochorismatase family protein [Candidatus Bathyarchaeia archaeon]|jgi:nicotinamidase/pyrazinamidase